MTELCAEINTNEIIEKTPPINPKYRQIDNFTDKDLDLINESLEENKNIPYDVVYNFYKFLKTLTKEQQKLYLEDSDKLWKELKVDNIDENFYTFDNIKIEDEKHELINFRDKEESEKYWNLRKEGKTHEEIIKEMNIWVKKNGSYIFDDDDDNEEVRVI
jgi:polyribonucleotide nucleotidyltransferase